MVPDPACLGKEGVPQCGPQGARHEVQTYLLSSPSMYSFFRRRLSCADCLLRIFLLTFLRALSSA